MKNYPSNTIGAYWADRAKNYPPELYTLACRRYSLPLPMEIPDQVIMQAHPLVPPPKADYADDLMAARYYFHYPTCVPACSLRLATLNINGALHSPDSLTTESISRLMDVQPLLRYKEGVFFLASSFLNFLKSVLLSLNVNIL